MIAEIRDSNTFLTGNARPVSIEWVDAWHERVFRYLFLLLIFGYPVSTFVSEFLGIQSNIISIAFRAFQLMGVALYAIFLFVYRRFSIKAPVFLLFLLFWLMYSIRIIADTSRFSWKLGIPASQYYLFGIVMSFLMTIPLYVRAPVDKHKTERVAFWLLLALNAVGLYTSLSADLLLITRVGSNERLNPITTAFIAVWMVCICLKWIFLGSRKSLVMQAFLLACIFLGITNMVFASTKLSFLFLALFVISLLYVLYKEGRLGKLVFALVTIAAIATGIILSGYGEFFTLIISRFTDISEDESSMERVLMVKGAISQFVDQPLTGSFLEEFQLKMYPHNTILEAFMATGIAGGCLYLVIFSIYVSRTFYSFLQTRFHLVSLIALGYLMIALVSGTLAFGQELWYCMAIMASCTLPATAPGQGHRSVTELTAPD